MILGPFGLLLMVILIIFGTIAIKNKMSFKNKNKFIKNKKKLQNMIVNGIHESVNNGSLPLLIATMFDLKNKWNKEDSTTYG